MSILIAIRGWEPEAWCKRMAARLPGRKIHLWPAVPDPAGIHYGLAWKPPDGAFDNLPNLQVLFSLGAGVDHIMRLPNLPDVPIARIVDDNLTARMREWVVLQVLLHHRRHLDYAQNQRARIWNPLAQPTAAQVRIGILGLGQLGSDAARTLLRFGFQVAGWSRTAKAIPGVTCYSGPGELDQFLGRTDILVCLLPLTPHTRGFLNSDLFTRLARDGALPGPVLINGGRGGLQVEADILAALEGGTLSAVSLDVFTNEPFDTDHPLWVHPRAINSPHVAADSDPDALTDNIARQIVAFEAGEPLANLVDRQMGY